MRPAKEQCVHTPCPALSQTYHSPSSTPTPTYISLVQISGISRPLCILWWTPYVLVHGPSEGTRPQRWGHTRGRWYSAVYASLLEAAISGDLSEYFLCLFNGKWRDYGIFDEIRLQTWVMWQDCARKGGGAVKNTFLLSACVGTRYSGWVHGVCMTGVCYMCVLMEVRGKHRKILYVDFLLHPPVAVLRNCVMGHFYFK